jgi:hypothetical protein
MPADHLAKGHCSQAPASEAPACLEKLLWDLDEVAAALSFSARTVKRMSAANEWRRGEASLIHDPAGAVWLESRL